MKHAQTPKNATNDGLLHIPVGYAVTIPQLLQKHPIADNRIRKFETQVEYLLLLMSLIFVKQKQRHGDNENEEVPFSSSAIRRYGKLNSYVKWLCDRKILIGTGYQAKTYSRRFKFSQSFSFEPYRLQNEALIVKVREVRKSGVREIRDNPTLHKLFRRLKGVEILPQALEWVKGSGFRHDRRNAILDIVDRAMAKNLNRGYFMCRGHESGRIFTPHTHLPKEIRNRFLRIDGEKPAELDLRCSQFQILYLLFRGHVFTNDRHNIIAGDFKSELDRYAEHFHDGNPDLYTMLAKEMGCSRDQMKRRLLSWLFSPIWQTQTYQTHRDVSNVFRRSFPMLFDFIMRFKSVERNSLAVTLQKIESDAVIDSVAIRGLYPHGFSFVTIHDSVIIPSSRFETVRDTVWRPTLRQLGIPQFQNIDTIPTSHPVYPDRNIITV